MRARWSEIFEALKLALDAIRVNKARGVLTTLGIIIGVVGVVSTMTAINGLSRSFKESVSVIGADVLYVSRFPWVMTGRFFDFRNRPNVSLKEAEKLAAALPPTVVVNPTANTDRSVKYRSEVIENVDIIGTTENHVQVSAAVPEVGRFLSAFEVENKRRVCVLGHSVNEKLFGGVDPLNKKIRVGRATFLVVGVMEKQGGAVNFGGPDFDSQIYIPITTFNRAFGGANRNLDIAVKAPFGASLGDFEYEVTGEMRKIRRLVPGEDQNFTVNKMDSLLDAFNNVMGVVLLIGILITGISLFVGGIGVANIMFVSVTERTREIGIRKAIGAKRRTILVQFLLESSAICLLGGFIGLALSYGVAELIRRTLMPASLSLPIAGVAIGVSIVVGVVAGIVPAVKAARLDPIEALRYE